MTNKTGGPAFPHIDSGCGRFEEGMTLRDYFAAKAMQGLLNRDLELGDLDSQVLADHAYEIADEMLEARK